MINFDWSFVQGSVLCTVHLVLGLVIGYAACYFARPDRPPPPAVQDLRQFKSAIEGLHTQVRHISAASQAHSTALPPAILAEIAKLVKSVEAVQSQFARRGAPLKKAAKARPLPIVRPDPPQAVKPSTDAAGPAAFEGLSAPLYDQLTRTEGVTEDGANPLAERRPYHVVQYMAPWNGSLPQPVAYTEVACNDLSSCGVSFFTKEAPVVKTIAITLGHEHELLMQAEVVHCQRRKQANSFVYFIGCRFTKRIEGVPDELRPVRFEAVVPTCGDPKPQLPPEQSVLRSFLP